MFVSSSLVLLKWARDLTCKKRSTLVYSNLRFFQFYHLKWAATWQNQQCGCAPSVDSDQTGHPPGLIRVFAAAMKKPWFLSSPLRAQADLSLRRTHTHFVGFIMSWLKCVSCLVSCVEFGNWLIISLLSGLWSRLAIRSLANVAISVIIMSSGRDSTLFSSNKSKCCQSDTYRS